MKCSIGQCMLQSSDDAIVQYDGLRKICLRFTVMYFTLMACMFVHCLVHVVILRSVPPGWGFIDVRVMVLFGT